MNDQMFIETLIISSSFFAIAAVIVISVLILECGS
ncbi:TPA: small membrane protein YoaI [Citrobacter amalonaticus]